MGLSSSKTKLDASLTSHSKFNEKYSRVVSGGLRRTKAQLFLGKGSFGTVVPRSVTLG